MTLQTWTIEIRADFDGKEKPKLLLEDIRRHCKEMLATANLLADARKPQMSFSTSDMFVGADDIALFIEGEYESEILG